MAKKEKQRSEIPKKYTWDLSVIYKSDNELLADIKKSEELLKEASKYKGHILDSSKNLLDFLNYYTNLMGLISKIESYTSVKQDEDFANQHNAKLNGKASILATSFGDTFSFLEPELLKQDFSLVEKYINENKDLEVYRFLLQKVYKSKEHYLDEDKESLLSNFGSILEGYENIYNVLTNSEMKFGTFIDEEGEAVELTKSNYSVYSQSKDERVRKEVYNLLYSTYKKYNNTIALSLIAQMKTENLYAKVRGYNSALEASLDGKDLKPNVYTDHIKRVNNGHKYFINYLKLFQEVHGFDKIHPYDLNLPLAPHTNNKYTYEEAQNLVVKGLSVLGSDYTDMLKKAFKERWIDVYHNAGKMSGAYSMPCYFPHPFVLTNFEGEFYDVSTLAHELGHAINGVLSNENNPYIYHDNPIFLAEIASTTNEIILSRYLIDNTEDKNEKLLILDHLIDLYFGNLFEASRRAAFELEVHERLQNNEALTAEDLNNIWAKLLKQDYEDYVLEDEFTGIKWSRIPHFFMNYYNYQYSTGISIASYVASKVLSGDEEFIAKYKKFLSVGSSMYPMEALKIIDIDMSNDKVVNNALETFNNIVEEFKTIYESK